MRAVWLCERSASSLILEHLGKERKTTRQTAKNGGDFFFSMCAASARVALLAEASRRSEEPGAGSPAFPGVTPPLRLAVEPSSDRRSLVSDGQSPVPEGDANGAAASAACKPPPPSAPLLHAGHYVVLLLLNCIGAFSSDCYIPNLSDVVDDLKATDQEVSLTIQVNWYMLGFATPIVGYLSDVYGRKVVICSTLLVYVVGAVGSALAPTIGWLLAARCVQGVGESVSIITSAIIRDVVDDKQRRMRVQAYFTTMRPLMLLGG